MDDKRPEKNSGPRVKGTWLADWAKIINQDIKDHPDKIALYNQFLNQKDWELIKGFIVPSATYPYDFFRRLGRAVFMVTANQSLKLTRLFGRKLMENLLDVYRNMRVSNDPVASLQKFVDYHGICFLDVASQTRMINKADKAVLIELTLTREDKQFGEAAEAFAYQLAGNLEELATQAGAKNVKLEITQTPDNNFEYALSWE